MRIIYPNTLRYAIAKRIDRMYYLLVLILKKIYGKYVYYPGCKEKMGPA